jgi:hypothetical protein
MNPSAAKVTVGNAAGSKHCSSAQADIQLDLPIGNAKIMPSFQHNLMGIGKLCDNNCKVVFDKTAVTVFAQDGSMLLKGWGEQDGAKLWRFSLIPNDNITPTWATQVPAAFNAHDLPSVGALVHYLHAAAGFPVKSTWYLVICHQGRQSRQLAWFCMPMPRNIAHPAMKTSKAISPKYAKARSTKPKAPPTVAPPTSPASSSKQLHVWSEPISKLYTDDMGRFSVRSRSGNQYIMLVHHSDSNAILVEHFQSRNDYHRIPAYNRLMSRLKASGHAVDHQVLDNEASAEYIRVITEDWNANYQLIPPDIHRRNLCRTCHSNLQSSLPLHSHRHHQSFPNYLWDKLMPQTELTINLLRQSLIAPAMSAWEYYNNAPFNFDATPISPCGCPVIIHNKPNKRASWAFGGCGGFNIGPALSHYNCFQVVDANTKALVISNTVEFQHDYLESP